MAEGVKSLNGVIFWGGPNEEKTKRQTKWDHDILINASKSDKLGILSDPESLVPIFMEEEIESLKTEELYKGAMKYSHKKRILEVLTGLNYTTFKVYGKDLDYKEIAQRLISLGAKEKKPHIEIKVPDRPPLLDERVVKSRRYNYPEENKKKDEKKGKKYTISATIKSLIGIIFVAAFCYFIYYEAFVPKYVPIPLPPEGFLGVKGDMVGFLIEDKLTLLKFAEDMEDKNLTPTTTFYVNEKTNITNKIVVDRVIDESGETIYNIRNRQVEFSSDIYGYELVRGSDFEYDSYKNIRKPEGDWSKYGELGTGDVEMIVIPGRLYERDNGDFLGMGKGYAKMSAPEEELGSRFYDVLADNESYFTAIYGLRTQKTVRIFGQIEKTFTASEGRNRADRILFQFKPIYVRAQ